MENIKTIIFFDNSDPTNRGWAWRSSACSQGLHARKALDQLAGGGLVDAHDMRTLEDELESDGVGLATCILVVDGEEIGHIWPE